MPTKSLLINPNDTNLKQSIENLSKVPGYCIFIDVVGSTAMKKESMLKWVALIHNAFANATTFLDSFRPLKGIGDELMFYIEDSDRDVSGYSPLQIFDSLFQVATESDPEFPETKIAAAYCEDDYQMTFIPDTTDYYGIDIDRAARLKGIDPCLAPKELVIDSRMFDRVKNNYDAIGNKDQFTSFERLDGIHTFSGEGLPDPIEYYRATKA